MSVGGECRMREWELRTETGRASEAEDVEGRQKGKGEAGRNWTRACDGTRA